MRLTRSIFLAYAVVLGGVWPQMAVAAWCPFCPPSMPTLAEQREQADFAFLTTWAKNEIGTETAKTFLDVQTVIKQPAKTNWKKGQVVTLDYLLQSQPGDLFLVLGRGSDEYQEWDLPIAVTEISYQYFLQAPAPSQDASQRLTFFIPFLEYPDALIAGDAFSEFGRAKYEDVAAVAGQFSREKLREWLKRDDPQKDATLIVRRGFYGLMLGLCGNEDDAKWLGDFVLRVPRDDEMRLGIDGMMAGYLTLTGEAGLQRLVAAKFDNPEMPISEAYALLGALRFCWDYGQKVLPPEALRAAMRRMLNQPQLAEVAIIDLARWKDWEILGQLTRLYGMPSWDQAKQKRIIVQFAQACVKDLEAMPEDDPQSLKLARDFLAKVEQTEPELIRPSKRLPLGD